MNSPFNCALCTQEGGEVLWRDAQLRVVQVHDEDLYPGLCRVIWNDHKREFSDLAPTDRNHFMQVIVAVERSVLTIMMPDKINLASLGNQVPHLHWHVIPRYLNDAHFPNPIWSKPVREVDPAIIEVRRAFSKRLGGHLLGVLR